VEKLPKLVNSLQGNSQKPAESLYRYRESPCTIKMQLNFYIIGRKTAKKRKKIKEILQDCATKGVKI
jgi:hypothetical protein